jgi:hypothetical protein
MELGEFGEPSTQHPNTLCPYSIATQIKVLQGREAGGMPPQHSGTFLRNPIVAEIQVPQGREGYGVREP